MSQNDLVISNQTFPATRADINNALQALGSLNSGSSSPATTYANMMWYDTANNILKMRSEANDVWINVGYLDQTADAFRIFDDTQVVNTSGTQTGLIGDQSTAAWQAGTGTTQSLVSPANVKAAITALEQGGAIEFISTATLSNTTEVVFTGFNSSLYDSYVFYFGSVRPTSDGRYIGMYLSTDGGSTYGAFQNLYNLGTGNGPLEDGHNMRLEILFPHLIRYTAWTVHGVTHTTTGATAAYATGGHYTTRASHNTVKFRYSGNDMASGTISMYGVRKS